MSSMLFYPHSFERLMLADPFEATWDDFGLPASCARAACAPHPWAAAAAFAPRRHHVHHRFAPPAELDVRLTRYPNGVLAECPLPRRFDEDDVRLKLNGWELTVTVYQPGTAHWRERPIAYQSTLELASHIDARHIEATLDGGILSIAFPYRCTHQRHQWCPYAPAVPSQHPRAPLQAATGCPVFAAVACGGDSEMAQQRCHRHHHRHHHLARAQQQQQQPCHRRQHPQQIQPRRVRFADDDGALAISSQQQQAQQQQAQQAQRAQHPRGTAARPAPAQRLAGPEEQAGPSKAPVPSPSQPKAAAAAAPAPPINNQAAAEPAAARPAAAASADGKDKGKAPADPEQSAAFERREAMRRAAERIAAGSASDDDWEVADGAVEDCPL